MNVTHLECALCAKRHDANTLQNLCTDCGKPLLVRYDLERVANAISPKSLAASSEFTLWRYRDVLPVEDTENNIVSFGEGWTPLLRASEIAKSLPIKLNLYIKDEGQNPTQSFKARGMTAAISMAKELGVKKSRFHRLVTPPARWLHMRRGPEWKRSSLCRPTRRERISSSVSRQAHT